MNRKTYPDRSHWATSRRKNPVSPSVSFLRRVANWISNNIVGIVSGLLAIVAIRQTERISKTDSSVAQLKELVKKYDTSNISMKNIVEQERGQSGSLVELIEKNTKMDSLLQISVADLVEYRRLERKANYNKLNMALATILNDCTKVSDMIRNNDPLTSALPYIIDMNTQFAGQVDNPFMLANDSAVVRWKFRHGQTSILIDLLTHWYRPNKIVSPDEEEMNRRYVKGNMDYNYDMYFWFFHNIKPPK